VWDASLYNIPSKMNHPKPNSTTIHLSHDKIPAEVRLISFIQSENFCNIKS